MSSNTAIVIRCNGSGRQANTAVAGWDAATITQQQATVRPAIQQQQQLRDPTLPTPDAVFFEMIGNAFSQLAKRATVPFTVELAQPSTHVVKITIKDAGKRPPFPKDFSGFEIPGLSNPRPVHFIILPAKHPLERTDIQFDLGAFLSSRNNGIEDVEAGWYAVHHSKSLEQIIQWFSGWLGEPRETADQPPSP